MSQVSKAQLGDEVLEVLERSGPLCASQISAELLLPPRTVEKTLDGLQAEGKIRRRPDPHKKYDDPGEMPWGSTRRLSAFG